METEGAAMTRGGSGRRLTYRERWEALYEWVHDPVACGTYDFDLPSFSAGNLLAKMDKLDRTTLVKARPVRKGKGRKR
jgi:hypothetical protein